jgi:hypothetical protein
MCYRTVGLGQETRDDRHRCSCGVAGRFGTPCTTAQATDRPSSHSNHVLAGKLTVGLEPTTCAPRPGVSSWQYVQVVPRSSILPRSDRASDRVRYRVEQGPEYPAIRSGRACSDPPLSTSLPSLTIGRCCRRDDDGGTPADDVLSMRPSIRPKCARASTLPGSRPAGQVQPLLPPLLPQLPGSGQRSLRE